MPPAPPHSGARPDGSRSNWAPSWRRIPQERTAPLGLGQNARGTPAVKDNGTPNRMFSVFHGFRIAWLRVIERSRRLARNPGRQSTAKRTRRCRCGRSRVGFLMSVIAACSRGDRVSLSLVNHRYLSSRPLSGEFEAEVTGLVPRFGMGGKARLLTHFNNYGASLMFIGDLGSSR